MIDRSQPPRSALDIVERSAIARGLSSLAGRIESAAAGSGAMRATSGILARWRDLDRAARRRAMGTALITATAVHVSATGWYHQPVGWLWLVVPGIAMAQGLLLVVASRDPFVRS